MQFGDWVWFVACQDAAQEFDLGRIIGIGGWRRDDPSGSVRSRDRTELRACSEYWLVAYAIFERCSAIAVGLESCLLLSQAVECRTPVDLAAPRKSRFIISQTIDSDAYFYSRNWRVRSSNGARAE